MIHSFDCPSCGGPLEYNGGNDVTVRCHFCGNSVFVPQHLRAPASEAFKQPATQSANPRFVYLIFVVALITIGAGIALYASRSFSPAPSQPLTPLPQFPKLPTPSTPRTEKPRPSGFARVAFTF